MVVSLYSEGPITANIAAGKKLELEDGNIEICGRGFFNLYEAPYVAEKVVEEDTLNTLADATDGDSSPFKTKKAEFKSRTKTGMFKLDDALKGKDLYKLMNVDESANEKDIKKSFRDLCVVYHPDKVCANDPNIDEETANKNFVAFQEAFDILTDPVRRRKYDSSRPFDDTIPKEKEVEQFGDDETELFYETFNPVFERNAKWSTKQPVPMLPKFENHPEGSESAQKHLKSVLDFYRFWFDFDSWRDFDLRIIEEEGEDALKDPSKADHREEKRYIERENARIRQKYRNSESARILKLSEMAEKYDIRVRRYKEREWERKNAGKVKKEQERLERLAKEKAEEEKKEKEAKEEEERKVNEKVARENEKVVMKTLRRDLRKLRDEKASIVETGQFQELLLNMDKTESETMLKKWQDIGATIKSSTPKLPIDSQLTSPVAEAICTYMIEKGVVVIKLGREALEEAEIAEKEAELAAQEKALAAEEAAADEESKNSKKKGKKGKKGGNTNNLEDVIQAAEDAMDDQQSHKQQSNANAAAKNAKQQKMKQLEAENRAKAQEAAAKREEEKRKKEAEKKQKEEDEKKKKAEEMRKKHQAEAAAAKEAEMNEKLNEKQNFQYQQYREEQLSQLEKFQESDGLKSELESAITNDMKLAFEKMNDLENGEKTDIEDRIDVAAVIVANFTNLKFFEIAKRPTNVHAALNLIPSSLRNRIKKTRETLRKLLKNVVPNPIVEKQQAESESQSAPIEDSADAPQEMSRSALKKLKKKQEAAAAAGEPIPESTPSPTKKTSGNKKKEEAVPEKVYATVPDQWKKIFALEFPDEDWQNVDFNNKGGSSSAGANGSVNANAASNGANAAGDGGSKKKNKKKTGGGGNKDDEDFDAILAEFGGGDAGKKKER